MKRLLCSVMLLSSMHAFSACKTTLDIKLFSSPFADAKSSEKYKRVTRVFKTLGFQIVDPSTDPKYQTQIQLGVEKTQGINVLLSHVQVSNRNGKVVFEDYHRRKVQAKDFITTKQMLGFTARHLSRTFPLCD